MDHQKYLKYQSLNTVIRFKCLKEMDIMSSEK